MARARSPIQKKALSLPPSARLTPQRQAVLEAIASSSGAFTVIEVFDRARRSAPKLGLATTYRTLELLRSTGAVRPLSAERPTYVLRGPEHHHHLVCVSCGEVEETELCGAPSPAEVERRHGFAAEAHDLDIYGTCARCSE